MSLRSRSGDYRHHALIQSVVRTVDADGAPIMTFSNYRKIWCSFKQMGGHVADLYRQSYPQSTHIVRMRYLDDMTIEKRIVLNDRYYDVDYVDDVMQRRRIMGVLVHENINP